MALHIRETTDLPGAVLRLRQVAADARNLEGSSAGQQPRLHVTAYLNWASGAEQQVRNVFMDPELSAHLHGEAYWAIRNPAFSDFRVIELVNMEAREQARWFEKLADHLDGLVQRMSAAQGTLAVLDTHVLLHYQPPEQVKWSEVIGANQVRLVLPLRVIEELDKKKYMARPELADRARRLLSRMWAMLAPTAGGPTLVCEGVTIEVPIDEGPRNRSLDADEEILDTCENLRNIGAPVVLVTSDTGLSLRAVQRKIKVVPMPDSYLRKKPEPGTATSAYASGPS